MTKIIAYSRARRMDREFTLEEWDLIERRGDARNFTKIRRVEVPAVKEKPAPKTTVPAEPITE